MWVQRVACVCLAAFLGWVEIYANVMGLRPDWGTLLYRSIHVSAGVFLCEACRLSPLHRNRGMAPTPVRRLTSTVNCKL